MVYLFSVLKPRSGWQEMRRRRRLFWMCAALWIPANLLLWLVVSPLCLFLHSDVPAGVVSVSLMIGLVAVYIYYVRWPCPGCGKSFVLGCFGFRPFRGKCAHCDLPLDAPCEPAQQRGEFESPV